ncbi:MAG TPA: hypothetical protein VJT31_22065 [Rugosimonospora sp.]|nr:hypothetical protein [Rugosimonospora sp.]
MITIPNTDTLTLEIAIAKMAGRYGRSCQGLGHAGLGTPKWQAYERAATRQYKAMQRLIGALAGRAR